MNVGNSVKKAIDDWQQGELDAAMLHACNALDGTAAKVYPALGSNLRFSRLLRENYHIFGPMGAPGVDLAGTRFPVKVQKPKAPGGRPDIADVIYGIHRCSHGHGAELPDGFELLPDAAGPTGVTAMLIERGKVRLSDRVIFGLLAVAVMNPVNVGQTVPVDYYLTLAGVKLPIKDWWGRAADFSSFAAAVVDPRMPNVRLDFGDWMDVTL